MIVLILRSNSNRSHKKRKDSLETRAVLIKISMLSWNLYLAEGNQVFAGDFHAVLKKTNTIYKEMELEMVYRT